MDVSITESSFYKEFNSCYPIVYVQSFNPFFKVLDLRYLNTTSSGIGGMDWIISRVTLHTTPLLL